MTELPDWITLLDAKTNYFVVDPDIFYPEWLKLLGVKTPDQYWLEIAYGCMKWDSDMHIRLSGKAKPGRSIIRRVRADDGRKERWNLTMHPPGKIDINALSVADRSRLIRDAYRKARGFLPT